MNDSPIAAAYGPRQALLGGSRSRHLPFGFEAATPYFVHRREALARLDSIRRGWLCTVRGIAAPFESPAIFCAKTGRATMFRENAFETMLRELRTDPGLRPVPALLDHDENQELGRTNDGRLKLYQVREGLAFELEIYDNAPGWRLLRAIRSKRCTGVSPQFSVLDRGKYKVRGRDVEVARDVHVHEISLLIAPKAPRFRGTSVEVVGGFLPSLRRREIDFLEAAERR